MIFSNTEFYFAEPNNISLSEINLNKDEAKHLIQVMRHSLGDEINITDGLGNIYKCELIKTEKISAKLKIFKKNNIPEIYPNIVFYIPILKSSDRLEFALEKCVELGITHFVIYSSDKSYKRGLKLERLNKILLAAMKQSLNSTLADIKIIKDLKSELCEMKKFVIFDQHADIHLSKYLKDKNNYEKINFIIGPEGGFSEDEMKKMNNFLKVYVTKNRLRTETAVISAASFLSSIKF